jgi:hypothetical protein
MPTVPRFTPDELAWLRKQDAAGRNQSEIVAHFEQTFGRPISRQRVARFLDRKPRKVRDPDTIRLSLELTKAEAATVRRRAAALGYIARTGQTVGEGSLGELLRAVAAGEVRLVPAKRKDRQPV